MTSYIWFDLGYTLVYVDREEKYQQRLKQHGIDVSIEKLKLAFHMSDKYFMREFPGLLGKKHHLYAEDYHRILHQYLRLNEDLDFKRLSMPEEASKPKGNWVAFKDTIPTLKKLKEKGIGVGLISNWNLTAREVLKETNIYDYLDNIIISSEVNIEKPNEEIFKIAIKEANVAAEECIYIGDNYYDDVIGSRKVGMSSILINPYDKQGIEEIENVQIIANIKDLLPLLEPMPLSK